jgi:hypothetical protein
MEIKESLEAITSQEIDRKEFLKQIGLAGLAIFGVTRLISAFQHKEKGRVTSESQGYGGKINLRNR